MTQVVAKWINDHCGLNGHPVRLLTADDGSDPSRYRALAQNMVENQHVLAFLNNVVPISAPGADAYLTQKGVPVIGGDGAHSLWCQSTDMFFPGPCLGTIGLGSAAFAAQQGKAKLGLLYCVEAEPCRTLYQAAVSPDFPKTGSQLVYTAQVSLAQPEFTTECLQAQNHGATALELGLDANSVGRATRSCVQQGYHPLFLSGSIALLTSLAQDPNNEGITAAVPSFPWAASDLPAEQVYDTAIRQYAPGIVVGAPTAAAWVGGLVLQAAGANLPASPTSADFLDGIFTIRNNTFGGLTPPVTFVRGGHGPFTPPCYYLIQAKGGKWVMPNGSKSVCLQ
jgi:branched-chain amino acid transport system substrate-binding protein